MSHHGRHQPSPAHECERCACLQKELGIVTQQLREAREEVKRLLAVANYNGAVSNHDPSRSSISLRMAEQSWETDKQAALLQGFGRVSTTFPFRYVPPLEFLPEPFAREYSDMLLILDRYAYAFHRHHVGRRSGVRFTESGDGVLCEDMSALDLRALKSQNDLLTQRVKKLEEDTEGSRIEAAAWRSKYERAMAAVDEERQQQQQQQQRAVAPGMARRPNRAGSVDTGASVRSAIAPSADVAAGGEAEEEAERESSSEAINHILHRAARRAVGGTAPAVFGSRHADARLTMYHRARRRSSQSQTPPDGSPPREADHDAGNRLIYPADTGALAPTAPNAVANIVPPGIARWRSIVEGDR